MPGSVVQGFEHAFQRDVAVLGIGELANLVPVDRADSRSRASQPLGPRYGGE
jgi:hypothetical protein